MADAGRDAVVIFRSFIEKMLSVEHRQEMNPLVMMRARLLTTAVARWQRPHTSRVAATSLQVGSSISTIFLLLLFLISRFS